MRSMHLSAAPLQRWHKIPGLNRFAVVVGDPLEGEGEDAGAAGVWSVICHTASISYCVISLSCSLRLDKHENVVKGGHSDPISVVSTYKKYFQIVIKFW